MATVNSLFELISAVNSLSGRRLFRWAPIVVIIGCVAGVFELFSLMAFVPLVSGLLSNEFGEQRFPMKDMLFGVDPIVLGILFTAAFGFATLSRGALIYLQNKVGHAVGHHVNTFVFKQSLNLEYLDFVRIRYPEWNASLAVKSYNIATDFVIPLLAFITNSIVLVLIFLGLLLTGHPLAIYGLVIIGVVYILMVFGVQKSLKDSGSELSDRQNGSIRLIQNAFKNFRMIKLYGLIERELCAFSRNDKAIRAVIAKISIIGAVPRYVFEGIVGVVLVWIVLISSQHSSITAILPMLAGIVLGVQRSLPLAQAAYGNFVSIAGSKSRVTDVVRFALAESPNTPRHSDIEASTPHIENGPEFSSLRLVNVGFRYYDHLVFRSLSGTFRLGDTVLVYGKSGSGKSTLIDLIAGFLPPTEGELIVEADQCNYTNAFQILRSNTSFVPQNIFIMDGTIKDNLLLHLNSDSSVDDADIYMALERVGLSDLIKKLPKGIYTDLFNDGENISGGQRSRIGIARTLLCDRKIVIFDEITSALNEELAKDIFELINTAFRDRLVFCVTHDPCAIRYLTHTYQIQITEDQTPIVCQK